MISTGSVNINKKDSLWLGVQNVLSHLAAFYLYPSGRRRDAADGLPVPRPEGVQAAVPGAFPAAPGSWLICANHLTLVDSVFLGICHAAELAIPVPVHRWLPWNLPERSNFNRSPLETAICYLTKVHPRHAGRRSRGNATDPRHMPSPSRDEGQTILVFPEGGRSRTGRIDVENFSYGVGRFVKNLDRMKILCIYFRGDGQATWSSIPKPGDTFSMAVDVFEPQRLEYNGLKAQRDYAGQIVRRLSRMEERY